ncbi:MAG: nodulation protein NolW [Cycloclasticus sp. symbiont of Bathymodiolus heckerae]|nr:MAG: nodulation protein NolW [Cycloclasticus sp. symbiont of Bathymodiolus heckerae]
MKIKPALLFSLLLFIPTAYAELSFYKLNHKVPSEIIPSIKPFLQADETIGAGYNELILRVNPDNMSDIQNLIRKLDQPAHRLIIYVNRDGQFDRYTEGYNVNSHIQISADSGVSSSYRGNVKIYSTKNSTNDRNNQSIQVLEGHTAHISEGISEPVTNINIQQYGDHSQFSSNTSYRDASKGFYVTPRLSKDSVILEIAPWYESPLSKNRTSAAFIRASSVIRGQLNTWIKLASLNDDSSQTSSKILGRQTQTTKQTNTIWVKVVDLDAKLKLND